MKKIIIGAVVAAALMTGCKSVPSASTLYITSKAIGVSVALVANETKIDNTARNEIVNIVNLVDAYVPSTNETITVGLDKIVNTYVDKIYEEGKITDDQKKLILDVAKVMVDGVDYIVYVRYPKIGDNVVLVESAIHGYSDGFLTYFKPVNTMSASFATTSIEYDYEAYMFFKARK